MARNTPVPTPAADPLQALVEQYRPRIRDLASELAAALQAMVQQEIAAAFTGVVVPLVPPQTQVRGATRYHLMMPRPVAGASAQAPQGCIECAAQGKFSKVRSKDRCSAHYQAWRRLNIKQGTHKVTPPSTRSGKSANA